MARNIHIATLLAAALGLPACDEAGVPDDDFRSHHDDDDACESCGEDHDGKNKPEKMNTGSRNMHLERTVRFKATEALADADRGRRRFGLDETLMESDTTEALFEGFSEASQKQIVSNGRTCFTCHRGIQEALGLPAGRLSDSIPLTDPLFTGLNADAQGDPDAFDNLNEHGLVKYRVNRFDPRPTALQPYKDAFGWRKSVRLLNVGLQQGFLTDMRGRVMFEVARGAAFSHTQDEDDRFDDLFSLEDGNDIEAFLFSQFTDPQLAALRDVNDPMYQALVDDPFLTVETVTKAQKRGKKVFKDNCFACHNTPQIFSSMENVEPLGNGERPPNFPSWAPAVGKAYNIGISERNKHGLRFTKFNGPGDFEVITLPMAEEDGSIAEVPVDRDFGLALITARTADIGRFKVPQLRNLANNAPYFHDNSADTIEELVDYKCSDFFNGSADGQYFQISLSAQEKADLIAFLYVL